MGGEPSLQLGRLRRRADPAQPAVGQDMADQPPVLQELGLHPRAGGIAARLEVEDPPQPCGVGGGQRLGQADDGAGTDRGSQGHLTVAGQR